MRSLRGTLAASFAAVGFSLVVLSLVASYWLANGILVRQFDRGLLERATSLASLLAQVGEHVELHFADEVMPRYSSVERPEYFQLWIGERELERSVSLVGTDFASLPEERGDRTIWDMDLPDGRAGRAIGLSVPVHHYAPDPVSDPGPAMVSVMVAIERADLDEAIRNLLLGVVGFGVLLCALMIYLGTRVLALGLRPLDRLTSELARVETQGGSTTALASLDLPSELTPVASRIRSLTSSLQDALERERRTTASIAHELRTPIAELRAVTDVALQTPDDVPAALEALVECRDIAVGMHGMIATLLSLARARATNTQLAQKAVDLPDLVRRLWGALEPRAKARGLEWLLHLEEDAPTVLANDEALRAVLTNLFDNACSHTPSGGRAACTLRRDAHCVVLNVANDTEDLELGDLECFGEPFWRADEVRSDRDHYGLGLALARECALAAGMSLTFQLAGGRLEAKISLWVPRA